MRTGLGEPRRGPIYNGLAHFSPAKSWLKAQLQLKSRVQTVMTEHNSSDSNTNGGHELAVEEAAPKLKRPPLYRVVLINDDFTPMEFVVEVLESVFAMERNKATRVMLEVHTKGKGICGVYGYEIAETKVAQVTGIAQQQQHPLLCTMEEC